MVYLNMEFNMTEGCVCVCSTVKARLGLCFMFSIKIVPI